jgi:hypothetical protein
MIEKPIYFNVFVNDSTNPKAPTFKKNNVVIKEDIVIKAGTYDFAFFGNAINKEGQPNPHFKIANPWKPTDQKKPIDNKDNSYDDNLNTPF